MDPSRSKSPQLDNKPYNYPPEFDIDNSQSKFPNSNPSGMQDLRCYSASHATSSSNGQQIDIFQTEIQIKKGKSTNGFASKNWNFNDPELQRKKRVASYKAYTVEGKVKGSFKKSFRWIKDKYTQILYGYR